MVMFGEMKFWKQFIGDTIIKDFYYKCYVFFGTENDWRYVYHHLFCRAKAYHIRVCGIPSELLCG